jgi:uncharacterized protein involved in exopolysaccharide biosynthesis
VAASKARNVPVGQGTPGAMGSPRGRSRLNADTSAEPEGLTRRVVLNVLEAFFRRPWLHLLPIILLAALGGASAFSAKQSFEAVGTITVESSTGIGDITGTNNSGFNFDTPASSTARNINEKLRTNEFLNAVADKLQADSEPTQRALLRQTISESVTAVDDGDQLVRVKATSDRAELSLRIAQATIDSYIETIIASNVKSSTQTVEFFKAQVADALTAYQAAEQALNDYLIANNISPDADPPVNQQIVINSLQSDLDRKESQYEAKLQSLDQANLVAASTQTETEQRIQLTDPPELPGAPLGRLRKAVLTVVIFGVLGTLLALASVIAAATLDRTIRVPSDVTAKFGLDVLAVVPDARAR